MPAGRFGYQFLTLTWVQHMRFGEFSSLILDEQMDTDPATAVQRFA